MSQTTDTLFLDQQNQLQTSVQTFLRSLRDKASIFYTSSILELLVQVEEAVTASQLTAAVNRVQKRLWKLPLSEQTSFRATLITLLSTHTLQNEQAGMRMEAASWLRLFVQAGFVASPQGVFVTLVTAATHISPINRSMRKEQRTYLYMIFDCFWPFRYPYPAYSWQSFPGNEVFYPLATLLVTDRERTQDALISIFGELPSLNDEEIASYVLPVALQWANSADVERRRRITNILARLDDNRAEEALTRLLSDADAIVRENARCAAEYLRRA